MTRVVRGDGSAFLIDRTEVTNGQYDEFLRSPPAPSPDSLCAGPPSELSGQCQMLLASDAGTAPDFPRVCVDWCEAEAYCIWAGKGLCKDTSKDLAVTDLRRNSDFYAACSEDAAPTSAPVYGCGPGCHAADCNGASAAGEDAVLPVGVTVPCWVGPEACHIADLSGNVEEWTFGCARNTADGDCVVRGGSFASSASELECASKKLVTRRFTSISLGFRCCVDP